MATPSQIDTATWSTRLRGWAEAQDIHRYEDTLLLVLTLLIGATVGLAVVAFILVTEHLGARFNLADGPAWHRDRGARRWRARQRPPARVALPERPRERHPTDQDGAVTAERIHSAANRDREVHVLVDVARQWHCPRPRGADGPHRRGDRIGLWATARPRPTPGAVPDPHRHGRRPRGGLQHADLGGAVHPRGDPRRPPRARPGVDRPQFGDVLGRPPSRAGRRALVPRARLPTRSPGRAANLRASWA